MKAGKITEFIKQKIRTTKMTPTNAEMRQTSKHLVVNPWCSLQQAYWSAGFIRHLYNEPFGPQKHNDIGQLANNLVGRLLVVLSTVPRSTQGRHIVQISAYYYMIWILDVCLCLRIIRTYFAKAPSRMYIAALLSFIRLK